MPFCRAGGESERGGRKERANGKEEILSMDIRSGKGRKRKERKRDWVKRGIRAPCGAVYPEEHREER